MTKKGEKLLFCNKMINVNVLYHVYIIMLLIILSNSKPNS
jgi:hypothetical protein